MNLIYPAHAKNQVRFEEKREKNVSTLPDGEGSRGHSLQNEVRAGGVRARGSDHHAAGGKLLSVCERFLQNEGRAGRIRARQPPSRRGVSLRGQPQPGRGAGLGSAPKSGEGSVLGAFRMNPPRPSVLRPTGANVSGKIFVNFVKYGLTFLICRDIFRV